mmetsp:Transcript_87058/g.219173  ORF Transcript_87058/g.219173 Transcript_87058/m.219173 type:complete len:321 (+) Transcript_87058:312-1274(+)
MRVAMEWARALRISAGTDVALVAAAEAADIAVVEAAAPASGSASNQKTSCQEGPCLVANCAADRTEARCWLPEATPAPETARRFGERAISRVQGQAERSSSSTGASSPSAPLKAVVLLLLWCGDAGKQDPAIANECCPTGDAEPVPPNRVCSPSSSAATAGCSEEATRKASSTRSSSGNSGISSPVSRPPNLCSCVENFSMLGMKRPSSPLLASMASSRWRQSGLRPSSMRLVAATRSRSIGSSSAMLRVRATDDGLSLLGSASGCAVLVSTHLSNGDAEELAAGVAAAQAVVVPAARAAEAAAWVWRRPRCASDAASLG